MACAPLRCWSWWSRGADRPPRHSSEPGTSARVGVPVDGCTDRAPLARSGRGAARHRLEDVDNRAEVREFLTTRRARITPDQVGLPTTGTRRVPGLRRSEVAAIAGLSVEYYARLERGQIAGASSGVLDALARALQLDETERAHLFDLARAADGIPTSGRPRRRTPSKAASRLSLQWALEAITDGVAFVRDPRQNLLATNTPRPRVLLPGDRRRRADARTWPGSSSSTPPPGTSTPTGSSSPRCAWASCAPRPAATRTTADCRIWSASCPPEARPSAGSGPTTTSAPTAPAPSASTTPSSASSPSPTRSSPSPPSPGWSCSSTPPNLAPPPPNDSACSPLGRLGAGVRPTDQPPGRGREARCRSPAAPSTPPRAPATGSPATSTSTACRRSAPVPGHRQRSTSCPALAPTGTATRGQTVFVTEGVGSSAPRRPGRGHPPRRPRPLRG